LTIDIAKYNHYGDVSGTKVVYAWGGGCDFGWDNECQDLATGKVYRWDEPEMLTTKHKVEGDIVVWSGGPVFRSPWYREPLNIGIFATNLTTEVQKTLRPYTMSKSYSHPAISGKMVVWLEHLNLDTTPIGSSVANNWYNTPYNICGASITDLNSPEYFTIAENVGRRDPYAWSDYYADFDDVIDISGNIVVWEAEENIYGADISDLNDIKVFSICTDPARQYDPAISGNIVVWVDERNDGGDIYGADISDLEDIRLLEIVKEGGSQKEPAISARVIVYVDVRDGLYGGDIRTCYLTMHRGVLDIKLTGSPYGMGPAIDGSLIIWQDDYFGKARGISLEVAYPVAGH
jgi:beta propeller repeat protein